MTAEAAEAAAHWGGARALRLIRDRENAVFEAALPAGRAALRLHSDDLKRLADAAQASHRQTVFAVLGVGLMLLSVGVHLLSPVGKDWIGTPITVWLAGIGAVA